MICKICKKRITPEEAYHCPDCGADYCADCAAENLCECYSELKRYS